MSADTHPEITVREARDGVFIDCSACGPGAERTTAARADADRHEHGVMHETHISRGLD